jgi:hypothetical protein
MWALSHWYTTGNESKMHMTVSDEAVEPEVYDAAGHRHGWQVNASAWWVVRSGGPDRGHEL